MARGRALTVLTPLLLSLALARGAGAAPAATPPISGPAAAGSPSAPTAAPAAPARPADPAKALEIEAWQLFAQGSAASRAQALQRLAAARALLQRPEDAARLAQLWQMEGLVLFALARYREANQAYSESLRIHEQLGRPGDAANLRLSLAMGHHNLGEIDQARRILALVNAEGRRSDDTRLLISALELEAQLDARTGQPAAAVRRLEQALNLATTRADTGQQLRLLDSLAMTYLPLGQLAEVRRILERRKALAPGETSLAETVLNTLETRSRPEELGSPEQLEQLIRRFRAAGDLTNAATSLESLATVELNRGRLRRGLSLYQEALGLYEQQGMRGRAASSLRNIGQTHAALGDYGKALEITGRALELARAVGEDSVQIQSLLDLADLQTTLGSLELAVPSTEAALSLATARGDLFRQAQALNALADLRRRQQNLQEAAQLAGRALEIGTSSRMPLLMSSALATLTRARESLGELDAALQAAEQIESLGRERGDRWIGATGQALRGRVLLAQGKPTEALPPLEGAIALFRSQKQMPPLIATLEVRARVLTALGRLDAAQETYREEQRLCEEMGDPACQAALLYEQSRLSARQGRLQEALSQIERSLAISEGLRASLPSAELRQNQFAQVQDRYDWWIELLLQLHRQQPQRRHDLQALEVSERARARGLVELLSAARAEVVSGVDPALLTRRRQLDDRMRQLLAGRMRLRQAAGSGEEQATALADLEIRLAELQRQQQQLETQLRRRSPQYAALLLPQPLNVQAIQALLDDNTVMLVMHLGEHSGVLWLISRREVESRPLPGRAGIQALVARFHADLATQQNGAAAELSRQLLQPLASQLQGRRLAIVPHSSLFYLPFAALPAPGSQEPLVRRHELVTLPSASTLAILRSTPPPAQGRAPSLLLLADPVFGPGDPRLVGVARQVAGSRGASRDEWQRLPGTAREAAAISALLPPGSVEQRNLGFQASRQALLAGDLRGFRLLHIATHGKADGLQPERSRLVLSQVDPQGRPLAGNLGLPDIYNLQLAADLVVLSACQSGLGALVRGEGLVGLTRGFLHAGSRRVLASLWNVDDSSTAVLMAAFYRALLEEGRTPAAALRQAQLSLLADPRWRAPYHWAAFTLHGDWR
ncbi:MAG: CHAT domain-containing protein [Cyanobium sp.]